MNEPLDLSKKRPGPWDKHKDMIKLVDENNELLLEFRIGDKYHRKLLELGMIKLLEDSLGDEIKNHNNG